MPHALPAYFGSGNLNAAFITDNTLVAYPLILTTVAFKVLGWAKDSLTEKAISFRLQGSIVNGLWFGYLTIGPASDLLRRS
jgi:hypothetical protein